MSESIPFLRDIDINGDYSRARCGRYLEDLDNYQTTLPLVRCSIDTGDGP